MKLGKVSMAPILFGITVIQTTNISNRNSIIAIINGNLYA
jgi:hypothetical protein